jgi:zinc protease
MARRTTARPVPAWMNDTPVFNRVTPNGLNAFVIPDPNASIVVCDLYHPAGSVDDPAGKTGLAHFVEHMLFKGTERFPKGRIDALTYAGAGSTNAETADDWTRYWFVFPADRWEIALEIEADRIRDAAFDPLEVDSERRVIQEERMRDADNAQALLEQTHLETSYLVHPYRNPIVGRGADLESITADDLRAFHAAHYTPRGATLVVAGGVQADRALDAIEDLIGKIEGPERSRNDSTPIEPPQTARREFRLTRPEPVARALFGWRAVAEGHADIPALESLVGLLGVGRRARLWRELVEKRRIATYVDAGVDAARLDGRAIIQVEYPKKVKIQEIENAILETIDELISEGPSEADMAWNRTRLDAARRWEREDLLGLAAGLGSVAVWDDWRVWRRELEAGLAVEAEDVRRVASTYFIDDRLTLGVLAPDAKKTTSFSKTTALSINPADPEPVKSSANPIIQKNQNSYDEFPTREDLVSIEDSLTFFKRFRSPNSVEFHPVRTVLENGMRLVSERRPATGIAAIELSLDAGMLREKKPGVANLVSRLIEEGTAIESHDRIVSKIEDLGGAIEINPSRISLRVRSEDLAKALNLVADIVVHPEFSIHDLKWIKERIQSDLKVDCDDPAYLADRRFHELIYQDHPFARDPRGTAESIAKITPGNILSHYKDFYRPDDAILAIAGDFDGRRLSKIVSTAFKKWPSRGESLPPVQRPNAIPRAVTSRIARPGERSEVVLGHIGIARDHPDFDALQIVEHILIGGPGFNDRLSLLLRERMGIVYSLAGGIVESADRVPGIVRVAFATSPDQVDRAVAATIGQIRAIAEGRFSDTEIEAALRYQSGAWVYEHQTVGRRAECLVELERIGLPLDEPARSLERIAALTPDEIRSVARRNLDADSLVRVEVGPDIIGYL